MIDLEGTVEGQRVKERLQKLMAQAGIGSRRASETLIEQGRVRVNDKLAALGDQADPDHDVIEVDGKRLRFDQRRVYFALHKPRNVVTTNAGHRGDERKTTRELIPFEGHLFTIGRLDADSEGLVVLTNDGALAQRLSHPRYEHTKTYKVIVYGLPTEDKIDQWKSGVFLEEGKTAPAYVRLVKGATDFSTLKVVMTEGKKRQLRRVASLLGHPVRRLIRTHMGMLELGALKPGEWRELSPEDVKALATPAPEIRDIRRRSGRPARRRPAATEAGPEETSEGKRRTRRPDERKPAEGAAEKPGKPAARRPRSRSGPKAEDSGRNRRNRPGRPSGPGSRSQRPDSNRPRRSRGPSRRSR